ncbi:unnamed protein product [Coregonus sp. 'balchen']|nr:unnamed protein product [Coregonus sp. 'balchen']
MLGFPPIPESQLENADRQDTVDQMVKRYDQERAVITLMILRRKQLDDLTEKLQRDHGGDLDELLDCPPILERPLKMDCPPILERPLEMDCPPILERPLEMDCPPILERPLEMDCPPILERPLEMDCPPILERPLEMDCPPILERPLEMDCPPILERPLEMDCPPILERPLEMDCPPILERPLEMDCPPILEIPLEMDCPPILERPLEKDCPPILERPLEMDCPPILERPLEMDCPPILEIPLEMANSLNTEVAVNTQDKTQRMDKELGRERGSPLFLEHHHMSSPDEFTPEIHDQDNRGEYRFQCPSAGLFQCSITGLVFRMEGEGEVLYRTVSWNRRLLAQRGKRPAGPLFNIDCPLKSDRGVLIDEEREEVVSKSTKTLQNQALLDMVVRKGARAQEHIYQVLKEVDPYLVEDLEEQTV